MRKGKNVIFPFLKETTPCGRRFWQHVPVLHEAVEKLALLQQPLKERGWSESSRTSDN